MQTEQTLAQTRLTRLSANKCILGEPDIICIRQIKTSVGLFGRQKKLEDLSENYINGLVFPTTAHFSSFISSRYKAKDPAKHQIKAKLYMFDAYGEKDIQIQVSIPGSMEVKAFNLRGQPLTFNPVDYERAYYSSFLRSLYPMNYPGIVLYPLMNRIQILKPIIKNFIAFSLKHELRKMDYQLDLYQRKWYENQTESNLSIEILIKYCLENNFSNLLKIILEELRKQKSQKYVELAMDFKIFEKKYGQLIYQTAEKLLIHNHVTQLKEYQIKALFPLKKYSQVAFVGRSLIESGGTSDDILKLLLQSLIEMGEDQRFLKTLNLIYNLRNFQETKWRDVTHINSNSSVFELQSYVGNLKCLSQYPQLSFPFNNIFLNRLSFYQKHLQLLKKNTKEGFTINMLQKVEESLAENPPFYQNLISYVKHKSWNSLVRYRTECFWLQSDFIKQEEEIKNISSLGQVDRYSFFDNRFEKNQETYELEEEEQMDLPYMKEEGGSQPDLKISKEDEQQEDFDGNLSQHQYQKQVKILPKCSQRIYTARKPNGNDRKLGSKVQCNMLLEQAFFSLFNHLKLQNSLQSWQQKLSSSQCSTFSKMKKQIAAIILLKKGFLNQKLLQNKKCQEAFKKARSLSDSPSINIIACYQLILLYINNKSTAGVEFYLVQLLKILKNLGIEQFDIVPEWAKPILQFVIQHEGLSVIKNMHTIFKSVFGLYLRNNLSEEEVSFYIQLKK